MIFSFYLVGSIQFTQQYDIQYEYSKCQKECQHASALKMMNFGWIL